MGRDLTLKARLEKAGLTVIEVDGWRERGSTAFDPRGSVNHHTAGPRSGTAPSLGICINGRADLPGPLCNTYGARTETLEVHLIAAGRANHAGRGGWKGLVGNSSVYGHEEEHSGTAGEPLSRVRLDRMVRVHAAFAYGKFLPEHVCQHWEWTTRKIDFLRHHVDPTNFRALVAQRLNWMQHPVPSPQPQEPELFFAHKRGTFAVYFFEPGKATHVPDKEDLNGLAARLGIDPNPLTLSPKFFDGLMKGRVVG